MFVILTSFFANMKNLPKERCVNIANYPPKGMEIPSYAPLFPDKNLLADYKNGKISEELFASEYENQLLGVDPYKVAEELNGKILLCYEKDGDFCHRSIVRKWFLRNGILALEWKRSYSVAVVGSRSIESEEFVCSQLLDLASKISIGRIVSGGAKGVDSIARKFALSNRIDLTEIYPQWEKFGKSAGFRRNWDIWEESDFGVVFWDGVSKGTAHSFEIARKLGKPMTYFIVN